MDIPGAVFPEGSEIEFDSIKASAHSFSGRLPIIFHRSARMPVPFPAVLQLAGIGTEFWTQLAAQQLIQGNVEFLAFDVP